ncbi:type II secretion system GspH family protein [Shewanella alkalitolerans]|uniref:type II secretion system protein n=1 Tax=Shewanella alkalitolerans TaxID=2864209 RepID=UPI001C656F11|nr:type II secretion system protein [Shewanella alkalitolerans]QYJ98054.1 type II secretion system GspH family protein [Shewanella alkalitolerans]
MNKQNGFTLIELVVVIIILGILAVTAAPKFINLQSDARVSALQGVKGALQGANSLYYSKAVLVGIEKTAATAADSNATPPTTGTVVEGVTLNYGYIQAKQAEIAAALEITASDWTFTEVTGSDPLAIEISQKDAPTACKFTYTQAKDASTPPTYGAIPAASDC